MKYLNIGCGKCFNSSWINVDISSNSSIVISHNILKGLPFLHNLFDACYSSHVLEHLSQYQAINLLTECIRVLKPNGIIRLVVPDLEMIAKNYLLALERSLLGDIEAQADYDWMILELFDQMVRNTSGGEMGKYLSSSDIKNKDFILSRIGNEAEVFWNKINNINRKSAFTKLDSIKFSSLFKKIRVAIAKVCVRFVAGKESVEAFEIGLFRNSGEVHQWMYDRFSLTRLLSECGFVDIKVCLADESSIPEFNSYGLDIIDGKVRKPDSLFIEARKPL